MCIVVTAIKPHMQLSGLSSVPPQETYTNKWVLVMNPALSISQKIRRSPLLSLGLAPQTIFSMVPQYRPQILEALYSSYIPYTNWRPIELTPPESRRGPIGEPLDDASPIALMRINSKASSHQTQKLLNDP